MIAKVRIAPIEQWCDYPKTQSSYFATSGMEVEIHTEHMRVCENERGEMYREWPMTAKSSKKFSLITGVQCERGERLFVCNHMLEMD